VTSHSFRKTTATILDEAGLSPRIMADELGHARPSMTQDVYLGGRLTDPRAAAALEAALGTPKELVVGGGAAGGEGNCPYLDYGAPSGTRTPNPLIKSQLLCQLS
jgi:hypothetical protein